MQIGLLTLGDWLPNPHTGEYAQSQAERHRSFVEQAVLAEELGFSSVNLGEHHFCDYILSCPPVVLAAIAERTQHIRLSTGVTLAADLDPVRLAEDYATVDQLSGGRVEIVLGKGAFSDAHEGFGRAAEDLEAIYAENVELLLRLWTEEEVSAEPRFRPALRNVTLQPRPVQRPHPPMWIGTGGPGSSLDLAIRHGLSLMLPTVFGPAEVFRGGRDAYLEGWAAAGRDRADARIGTCVHTFVAPDSQDAERLWMPYYDNYLRWVSALLRSQSNPLPVDWRAKDMIDGPAMCGSPAQVVDRIGTLREQLDPDLHLAMFDPGGLPEAELRASMELFGTDVLPKIA